MATNCVTITVTAGTPVNVQNCSGSHMCDAGCPGATTNLACINADPCVLNECAAGCPDTLICGYCGNISTPDTMADPNSPCYVKPYTNYCEESYDYTTSSWTTTNHCKTGCPDALACGKCGNDACAGACLPPSNCGVGCPDATKCGMCGNLACESPITTPVIPTVSNAPTQNSCTPNSCAYGYSCNPATGLCVKNGTGVVVSGTPVTYSGGYVTYSGVYTTTSTTTVVSGVYTTPVIIGENTTTSGEFEFSYGGQQYDIDLSPITNNLPLVAVILAACVLGVVIIKRE